MKKEELKKYIEHYADHFWVKGNHWIGADEVDMVKAVQDEISNEEFDEFKSIAEEAFEKTIKDLPADTQDNLKKIKEEVLNKIPKKWSQVALIRESVAMLDEDLTIEEYIEENESEPFIDIDSLIKKLQEAREKYPNTKVCTRADGTMRVENVIFSFVESHREKRHRTWLGIFNKVHQEIRNHKHELQELERLQKKLGK